MTTHDKHLILQAYAFATEFLKEAYRASSGLSSNTHESAAQLRAALNALPAAIEGCACGCIEFQRVCARKDCVSDPFMPGPHNKIYCSPKCAHLVAVRRNRTEVKK